MRCPSCSRNHRQSQGWTCECGYRFVLDPKHPPFLGDRALIRGIKLASQEGTVAFTPEQLHATIFRRRNRRWWHRIFLARGTRDLEATLSIVHQWARLGRDVGSMITRPELDRAGGGAWPEPDLFDYGAEGIVVTGRPLLVDLLVANQVHTTAKVAIVDPESGYPALVAERLVELVARRPDLPIYLLHDTGPDGGAVLAEQARQRLQLADHPIIDLGLTGRADKLHRSMRWTRRFGRVPVDFLHPFLLTAGLAAAITQRCSLDELLSGERASESGSDAGWNPPWASGDDDFG